MFKRFVKYYKPHKLIFALDMTASMLVAITGILYPIITRNMLNDWIPNKLMSMIVTGGCILLAVYILRMGLRFFIQYYGHIMGVAMQGEMRSDLFNKLEKLPYSFFDKNETGSIMSRMTNDLFDIAELAHHGPENIFIASFTILGTFVYLLTINWILALVLFLSVPLCYVISIKLRLKSKQAFKVSKAAIADLNASVESSISGLRVTKAFTNSQKEIEKFEKTNKEYCKARGTAFKAMAGFFSTSQFVIDLFNVIILILGGIFLYKGLINFADYSAFILSVGMFTAPINQIIQFTEQFQSASAGFKRFIEIIDEKEERDNEGAVDLPPLNNSIKFSNVVFNYELNDKDILNNVSFEIKKGETVALIGPSGGGKTTICHLIPRFYEIQSGEILFDDKNITGFKRESLRKRIGIVQQDVFLFSGTIKDNILYGKPEASMEEIEEAARKANILEYVNTLPNGWDTEIGERGVRLSGGQKQRLSIARVFLKDPEILILDEATSALDNTTEMLIQESLNELSKGRTTIVVAHRLSTIKKANRIMVVSEGNIVESGTHDELIEKKGIYNELYSLQFRDSDFHTDIKMMR